MSLLSDSEIVAHLEALESNNLPAWKAFVYELENRVGNLVCRRRPPDKGIPRLLNLGCNATMFPGWINADGYRLVHRLRHPSIYRFDWMLDAAKPWCCASNHWDGILTDHVIEHLSYFGAITAFREGLRTLKPDAWIRISVPSLERFMNFNTPGFPPIVDAAEAVSRLTQWHQHRSVWSAKLMIRVLKGCGFVNVREVDWRQGSDKSLCKEADGRMHESIYIEAQKPDVSMGDGLNQSCPNAVS
jgi:predicted SAM-dependent methyltransferase